MDKLPALCASLRKYFFHFMSEEKKTRNVYVGKRRAACCERCGQVSLRACVRACVRFLQGTERGDAADL
jgi:hypothetical protein